MDLELLLRQAGMRFTKEVDETGATDYVLPFQSGQGLIFIRVSAVGGFLAVTSFLRTLDSVAVRSEKELLKSFLRLHSVTALARVLVYTLGQEEIDWIAVAAEIPLDAITEKSIMGAIQETAGLAERVLATIAAQGVPTPSSSPGQTVG